MEGTLLSGALSAQKRHRQSIKRRFRNKAVKSGVRSAKRRFLTAVDGNDVQAAESEFVEVSKLIDTAAGKGVFHKNTAARTKSRLQRKLNQLKAE
jgi:small subunit ribosomal protein S20